MFDSDPYTVERVMKDPVWSTAMLNTFLVGASELRKYLDTPKVREEFNIPEDIPDDYIRDWFGHPGFGRH